MNFIKFRYASFTVVLLLLFITTFSLFTKGLNYGIDFKGGYVLETKFSQAPNLDKLRTSLENLKIGAVSMQQIGNDKSNILIKLEDQGGKNQVGKVKDTLGKGVAYRQVEVIGPKVGKELVGNAVKSVLLTLLAMLIYITIRFQWRYALSAILTIFYDCMMIVMLYTVFPFEFSESAIIGILITAGYSINDTIVIFDRIRENLLRRTKLTVPEIINGSIQETLSRTTLTVAATMLSLLAMYFLGGAVIAEFSLPIIVGVISGTFSSIFVAAPLLLVFGFSKHALRQGI
ncbi:MAG: protein translocase subunit SecF [Alphaproteobacteria bacterium]|nr:MAG: protein translocase subunit SecF [Alphaproteobacteria bacterium]